MSTVSVHGAPAAHTSFVGRREEIDAVRVALAPGRMITLLGPGGCGKSRLAAAVAVHAAPDWPDGAWWVDLGGEPGPQHVSRRVAGALAPLLSPGPLTIEAAGRALVAKRLLLVVDNCEHVLDEVADAIGRLLSGNEGLAVLATSQVPLAMSVERAYRVPPLSLADAVELFTERAGPRRPDKELPRVEERHAARRICERLDRLPLALELAAGWSGTLTAAQIADALEEPLGFLDGGPRSAPFRQRSLAASLAWSHGLLGEDQRVLFRRLAVFRPGFTAALLSEVCGFGELRPERVLRALRGLVEASLVVADTAGAEARYSLPGVVHAFADARLEESTDDTVPHARHLAAYRGLVERAAPLLETDKDAWREALMPEYPNLRAAVEWGLAQPDSSGAGHLAANLAWLWHLQGLGDEGLPLLRRAAEVETARASPVQARVLLAFAIVADPTADRAQGYAAARRAAEMAEIAGDWPTLLLARTIVAIGLIGEDLDAARALAVQVVTDARQHGCTFAAEASQVVLGLLHLMREEYVAAIATLEESTPGLLARGDRGIASTGMSFLALAHARSGNITRAAEIASEAVAVAEPLHEVHRLGAALSTLAEIQRLQDDLEGADTSLDRLAGLIEDASQPVYVPGWERAAAQIALCRNDPPAAIDWCRREGEALGAVGDESLTLDTQLVLATALLAHGRPAEGDHLLGCVMQAAQVMTLPGNLATAAELRAALTNDPDHALAMHHEALRTRSAHRLVPGCIDSLEAISVLLSARGQGETAAVLASAARRARHESGYLGRSLMADHRADTDRLLHDPQAAAAVQHGDGLSLWEAAEHASRSRGPRRRPNSGWESLTPTELSVVELAATGLTNPQIADRMFVTRGTVKTHLAHVYAKLGVANRTELARALREVSHHTDSSGASPSLR